MALEPSLPEASPLLPSAISPAAGARTRTDYMASKVGAAALEFLPLVEIQAICSPVLRREFAQDQWIEGEATEGNIILVRKRLISSSVTCVERAGEVTEFVQRVKSREASLGAAHAVAKEPARQSRAERSSQSHRDSPAHHGAQKCCPRHRAIKPRYMSPPGFRHESSLPIRPGSAI